MSKLIFLIFSVVFAQNTIFLDSFTTSGRNYYDYAAADFQYTNSSFNNENFLLTNLTEAKYFDCDFEQITFTECFLQMFMKNVELTSISIINTAFVDTEFNDYTFKHVIAINSGIYGSVMKNGQHVQNVFTES